MARQVGPLVVPSVNYVAGWSDRDVGSPLTDVVPSGNSPAEGRFASDFGAGCSDPGLVRAAASLSWLASGPGIRVGCFQLEWSVDNLSNPSRWQATFRQT
jgi:hypothetical protein